MPKGTNLARVSTESAHKNYSHDPLSNDVKYVSTNPHDNNLWFNYFANRELSGGRKIREVTIYQTKHDIKVAKAKDAGEIYINNVVKASKKAAEEAETFYKEGPGRKGSPMENTKLADALDSSKVGVDTSNSMSTILASYALQNNDAKGRNVGSKMLTKELKARGYNAVQDALGWNVSNDPLIVFDPKDNLSVASRIPLTTDKVRSAGGKGAFGR